MLAFYLLLQAAEPLADWTAAHAPYGFDITRDGSFWINIADVGRKDDYAILAEELRSQSAQKFPEFWVRGYHAKNPELPYRESKIRYRMDCERRTMTTVMEVMYDAEGNLFREWVAPSSGLFGHKPVVPGSLGARLYTFVCPA